MNIATLSAVEEVVLGASPCTGCRHQTRCSDKTNPVACRDFSVNYVDRGQVVSEHRVPARFWWLSQLELDETVDAYNEDGLPIHWHETYWRGIAVAAATRIAPGLRATLIEEELGLLKDIRLENVFTSAVSDADEYKISSSQVWRSFCRLSGPPPAPLTSPDVERAVDEIKEYGQPCAIFIEGDGAITVVPASWNGVSARIDRDTRSTIGVYGPELSKEELIGEIAWAKARWWGNAE